MKKASILILAGALGGLGACGPTGPSSPPPAPAASRAPAAPSGYLAPPSLTASQVSGARVFLSGRAAPAAHVRLASPDGDAMFTDADAKGLWRLSVSQTPAPQLFGLSMTVDGRQVQAQGYVLVTPKGRAALLRAGAGAVTLDRGGAPRITALDFDAEGGAVVSGLAPSDTPITVSVDDRQMGEGRSDAAGRFSIVLSQPLSAGQHRLQISGESWDASANYNVTPAGPVAGAPYHGRVEGEDVRVDWITPGGGLQTTLVRN
ncbi:hypothetical protein [Phenylobacterium sp.]|uniref:hypothetical protein n=1 Tax=Phenylobacterium sp. TaxID=1871053 RepID=UPI0035B12A0C